MKKPEILAIANHKGGVGKTSVTVNLAHYMFEHVKKILVIDMDPQAHTTWWLCKGRTGQKTISDLLMLAVQKDIKKDLQAKAEFEQLFHETVYDNFLGDNKLSIVPASLELATTKIEISSSRHEAIKYFRITEAIKLMASEYDMVLIDCPPSIELLTWAAVAAANYILLPVQYDALSIRGAKDVMENVVPYVKEHYNPDLQILGLIPNSYHGATVVETTDQMLKQAFPNKLFKTHLSRSVRVGELTTLRKTIEQASPKSKSAAEFRKLTAEIIRRIEEYEKAQ